MENLQLTPKQVLILFFIETGFADTDYKLIKHLDRSNYFPASLDENLAPLFAHHLIDVTGYDTNGHPFKYSITEQGRQYLDRNLQMAYLLDFADGYMHKDFILEMIPLLLKERKAAGEI